MIEDDDTQITEVLDLVRGEIDLSWLHPITRLLAADAPPPRVLTHILSTCALLSGAKRALLLVEPTRLARTCAGPAGEDGVQPLGMLAGVVNSGVHAETLRPLAGGDTPVRVPDGLVLPLAEGGVLLLQPKPSLLSLPGRESTLQVLADLAGGALHLARRLDEAHRRAQALEAARQRLHDQNTLLREIAVIDALTGLHNRRYFDDRLKSEIKRFTRYARPFGVLLFDADHFKAVNDTHGHQVGDRVLQHLARVAQKAVRHADLVARHGGEEFAVLMPETDLEGLEVVAERLRQSIATTPYQEGAVEIPLTVSVGGAIARPGRKTTASELMRRADKAMYAAKAQGRNRVVVAPEP